MARFAFALPLLAVTLAGAAPNALWNQVAILSQGGPVRTTESWDWSDCGLTSDPIQIESIVVTPDPPKPGQEMTVTVKASAQEVVEDGAYADVTVKLGVVKLLHREFDLCEEARNANMSVTCPVDKGDYTVVQSVTLPKEIPQARFTVDVQGYTVDDDDLFCVNLKVNFMKFPRLGW
ncbi:ML domain-containing protein [Vararia minispora EC-137]|uniref:ML domain-containing protein n=1 Tax=Vararia minispora EC-137 TaxID=1314806 RepID=A0ACB8QRM0_9AGAM|nr:ML domain-containing protein [Vararia minispora EC-137]